MPPEPSFFYLFVWRAERESKILRHNEFEELIIIFPRKGPDTEPIAVGYYLFLPASTTARRITTGATTNTINIASAVITEIGAYPSMSTSNRPICIPLP